ncbi:MAG: GntR family transcriptional regulator [Proteobacteria bacterium]|nr:GntR family transcriptional regulator [Pseudomonadota bacterium]
MRTGTASGGKIMAKAAASKRKPVFVAERRMTIAQQAYQFLRREIVDGRLVPRAPLSEADLSASLGVSRTPVREALIKLADEGLVDIYPQFGSFVAPIDLAEVYDSQFVRESLECAALGGTIDRLDAESAARLRGFLDVQRTSKKAGDLDAFFGADEAMHAFMMAIAGHPAVWPVVENAKAQMDRVRHLIIRREVKLAAILTEHAAIVDGVIRRDLRGATEALRTHLRGLFASVEVLMGENKGYFVVEGEGPPRRAQRDRK